MKGIKLTCDYCGIDFTVTHNLDETQRIVFCPFCGKDFGDFGDFWDDYDDYSDYNDTDYY